MTGGVVVGPVDWGSHDGNYVEKVLSVLLLQEREGWRRGTSAGDRGVDVAYPEEGGYVVDQIKSFTGRLTSRRKQQIKESLEQVIEDPALPGPVVRWRLVLPMNPSREAEKWFRELTEDSPFPCEWKGSTFVDGLAARHAHVIDYYFRDGRARLEQKIRDLQKAAEALEHPDAPLRAAEAGASLAALYEAVNREDPHFRYEFEITARLPTLEDAEHAGCLMAQAVGAERGPWVVTRVFARYAQATDDRPVPINLTVRLGPDDEELRQDLHNAFAYGGEVSLPPGTVEELTVDAPGGVGVRSAVGASFSLLSRTDGAFRPFRMRLHVTDPTGGIRAQCLVEAIDRRPGSHGSTLRFRELEDAFAFTVTIGVDDEGAQMGRFKDFSIDLSTQPASRLGTAVGVLVELHRPNLLRLYPEVGPMRADTGAWWTIESDDPPVAPQLKPLVGAITAIQDHTTMTLSVPEELTPEGFRSIVEAGRLAKGETVTGRWAQWVIGVPSIGLEATLASLQTPQTMVMESTLEITVGEVVVDLGPVHRRLFEVQPVDEGAVQTEALGVGGDDEIALVLHAGENDRYELVLGPFPGAPGR